MKKRPEPDAFDAHLAEWWSGEVSDPRLSAIFGMDDRFPHIDEPALVQALKGFSLSTVEGVTMAWLALAVRRAIAQVTPSAEAAPENWPGNANIRKRFSKLAQETASLRQNLLSVSEAETAILMQTMNDAGWDLLENMPAFLDCLHAAFETISRRVNVQRGNFTGAMRRKIRVAQAYYLSPIFEKAFGRRATVVDSRELYAQRKPADYGPWPDFFERMIALATGASPSAEQVRESLKEARKYHLRRPALFSPAIIPEP